jgi:hypothetical protein
MNDRRGFRQNVTADLPDRRVSHPEPRQASAILLELGVRLGALERQQRTAGTEERQTPLG